MDELLEILEAAQSQDRPYGCKCQSMRVKLLGDGCDECNPDYLADMEDEDES
jgi:hypothetical protein